MHFDKISKPPVSTFLSCEKDAQIILEKLFLQSAPYDEGLKRLLVINTRDCLDNLTSEVYKKQLAETDIKTLLNKNYIQFNPKIQLSEHEEVKSYLLITFDNFAPNATNPEFRDCTVFIDILCNTDYWDLGACRIRPLKIAGYIDGILNKSKLTGIGTFNFLGCHLFPLSPELSGYSLSYRAIHDSEDHI